MKNVRLLRAAKMIQLKVEFSLKSSLCVTQLVMRIQLLRRVVVVKI